VRAGDVILDIAGKPVNDPSDVRQALKEASSAGKRTVLMRIKSGDSTHFVAMPVAAG
jgi:serine protease Do